MKVNCILATIVATATAVLLCSGVGASAENGEVETIYFPYIGPADGRSDDNDGNSGAAATARIIDKDKESEGVRQAEAALRGGAAVVTERPMLVSSTLNDDTPLTVGAVKRAAVHGAGRMVRGALIAAPGLFAGRAVGKQYLLPVLAQPNAAPAAHARAARAAKFVGSTAGAFASYATYAYGKRVGRRRAESTAAAAANAGGNNAHIVVEVSDQ